jgi:tetratricopeptide (TPR) repeat protein
MKRFTLPLAIAATLLAAEAAAKPYCGALENGYGPYDFRQTNPEQRKIVEDFHFTEQVEHGIRGNTGSLGADLDYTLRVYPNHVRALDTLVRLAPRARGGQLHGTKFPLECYFERAVRFQPSDGAAWALYARYLYAVGQEGRALPMLEQAVQVEPDNPTLNYNYGLALAKRKQYAAALPYAQKAYAKSFPLPGLKQMLVTAGQWQEPPPAPEAAPQAEPAAQGETTAPAPVQQ